MAHAMISGTRPQSFTSSIQLGLGAFLFKKYGSKELIDLLAALGFCSSYQEVKRFEAACLQQSPDRVMNDAFIQMAFDNADVNVDTIDGLNTFHAMGGIQCVTPGTSVTPGSPIEKVKHVPSALTVGEFGHVPVMTFQRTVKEGLRTIKISDLNQYVLPDTNTLLPSDFLWIYGKWKGLANIRGWNGFMEELTSGHSYSTSLVICLPFVNSPPTNYDTIYTVLSTAAEKCKAHNQNCCFVTFDQPLFIKARDIVASVGSQSDVGAVIVRLGGFHLLMSFMGAVGFIMEGGGLQGLFSLVFAAASTKKMMTGHAYSRALRGHILAHLALAKLILPMADLTEDEHAKICLLYTSRCV